MEGLTAFLSAVGGVFTQLITWLASTTTALLTNEIFIIIVAIALFSLLFYMVVGLAKSIRGRRKGRKN